MVDGEETGSPSREVLKISDRIVIPLSELEIRFTRSQGPGGQHVNKTSTQVEVTFDLLNSPSIPEADRGWLLKRLASKLDSAGSLQVSSQEFRSQSQNKKAAIEKLTQLLREGLKRPKPRKKTKPSKASVEKRIEGKKRKGETKRLRQERF